MIKQQRFKSMKNLKPPRPTIREEKVATKIAERIIDEVNLDEFYWEGSEIEDRITDVAFEIMRCGRPATVFGRLYGIQPRVGDKEFGLRVTHPYGWEGIDDHCRAIADEIAAEELRSALAHYKNLYE